MGSSCENLNSSMAVQGAQWLVKYQMYLMTLIICLFPQYILRLMAVVCGASKHLSDQDKILPGSKNSQNCFIL